MAHQSGRVSNVRGYVHPGNQRGESRWHVRDFPRREPTFTTRHRRVEQGPDLLVIYTPKREPHETHLSSPHASVRLASVPARGGERSSIEGAGAAALPRAAEFRHRESCRAAPDPLSAVRRL